MSAMRNVHVLCSNCLPPATTQAQSPKSIVCAIGHTDTHTQPKTYFAVMWWKWPLEWKFKKRIWHDSHTLRFICLCQVRWKSLKVEWPKWCVVYLTKKNGFQAVFIPASQNHWSNSAQHCSWLLFLTSHSSVKFRPHWSSFQVKMGENISRSDYNWISA